MIQDLKDLGNRQVNDLKNAVGRLNRLKGLTDNVIDTVQGSTSIKAKLKRDSVEMKVQTQYNEMEKNQLLPDQTAERTYCERQRRNQIATFPLIPLEGDASDGIACLNTNRDMIVDAFCNFRMNFDDTLWSHDVYKKEKISGKAFWPRICCANEGDCKDHPDSIKQTQMRPFVLAQGGNLTKEAMRGEIFDLLGRHAQGNTRVDGLLFQGMLSAMKGVERYAAKTAMETLKKEMKEVFESLILCGPRVFSSPGKETTNMCELFYSYTHLMKSFLEQFKEMLEKGKTKSRLGRRLLALKARAGGAQIAPSGMGKMIQAKTGKMNKLEEEIGELKTAVREGGRGPPGPKGESGKDGVDGRDGSPGKDGKDGVDGKQGRPGNDGVGLHLKEFRIESNYAKGDYVFAKSTKGKYHSMYIAERSFRARKIPSLDVGNWEEFTAPKGEDGKDGKTGPKGESGKDGVDGKASSTGQNTDFRGLKTEVKQLTNQVAKLEPSRPTSCLHDIKELKFENKQALQQKQDRFCKEYGLDLSDPRVVNVAMVYLGNNWQGNGETKEAFRRRLQENAKFDVTDQCTHDKMFTANDMSIQEIDKMDGQPGEKEWVLLMKLDWANKKGYLASQLQDSKDDNKCRKLDYLPHTEIGVQVYEDTGECCKDSKDYWGCAAKETCTLKTLEHHWREQPLSFKLTVTGSVFTWKLHEFLLAGTQFTKATKSNSLVLGNNVNDGTDAGPSFLEIGSGSGISKADFEAFLENAMTGSTEASTKAKDVFEGVSYDGSTFTFECGTSERLCAELTAQSRRVEPMTFEHGVKSFALTGDGQFVYYDFGVGEKTQQRRRLLQRRERGC
jgi:hypothetical protein